MDEEKEEVTEDKDNEKLKNLNLKPSHEIDENFFSENESADEYYFYIKKLKKISKEPLFPEKKPSNRVEDNKEKRAIRKPKEDDDRSR